MDRKLENDILGGQAVIEGVMMRRGKRIAIAVRKPDGKIVVKKQVYKPLNESHKLLKLPVIRGFVNLIDMLKIGIGALSYSADIASEEEEKRQTTKKVNGKESGKESKKIGAQKDEGISMGLAIFFSITFAILLFKVLPLGITEGMYRLGWIGENNFVYNLIDGALRLLVFILYLIGISILPDVRILFSYHGAEHKAVHAYEAGKMMTVANVRGYPPQHERCGTSFLILVMILFILIFSLIPINLMFLWKLLPRLAMLPLIAGLAYELLKIASKYQTHWFFRSLNRPGIWIQNLTTREPTGKQMEVAIEALKAVL